MQCKFDCRVNCVVGGMLWAVLSFSSQLQAQQVATVSQLSGWQKVVVQAPTQQQFERSHHHSHPLRHKLKHRTKHRRRPLSKKQHHHRYAVKERAYRK